MTVKRLKQLLNKISDENIEIFIWDPGEEISGIIRDTEIEDIIHPTNHKEVFIIADFG